MSNEINSIIDSLCNKFCVTTTYLIEEMAKYHIARSGFACFITLLLAIVEYLFMRKFYPVMIDKESEYDYDTTEQATISFWVSAFFMVITFIVFICNGVEVVSYIASPTAAVIDDILHTLSN